MGILNCTEKAKAGALLFLMLQMYNKITGYTNFDEKKYLIVK